MSPAQERPWRARLGANHTVSTPLEDPCHPEGSLGALWNRFSYTGGEMKGTKAGDQSLIDNRNSNSMRSGARVGKGGEVTKPASFWIGDQRPGFWQCFCIWLIKIKVLQDGKRLSAICSLQKTAASRHCQALPLYLVRVTALPARMRSAVYSHPQHIAFANVRLRDSGQQSAMHIAFYRWLK